MSQLTLTQLVPFQLKTMMSLTLAIFLLDFTTTLKLPAQSVPDLFWQLVKINRIQLLYANLRPGWEGHVNAPAHACTHHINSLNAKVTTIQKPVN